MLRCPSFWAATLDPRRGLGLALLGLRLESLRRGLEARQREALDPRRDHRGETRGGHAVRTAEGGETEPDSADLALTPVLGVVLEPTKTLVI